MKKRDLTSEETALWRRTTKDVKRLDARARLVSPGPRKGGPTPPSASFSPLKKSAGAARAYAPLTGPATGPAAKRGARTVETVVGAGDPLFDKRVSRRRMAIDRRLDLHGMTQAAAQVALRAFLAQAASDGCRCVLVITGKGGGPTTRGVLHSRFSDWVNEEGLQRFIARAAPAHQKDGGAGAWYIFLKAQR